MGSVATSAIPERLQTWLISSGKALSKTFSTWVLVMTTSSRLVPARRTVPKAMAPSESFGMNSEPRFGATTPNENPNTNTANAKTAILKRMVSLRIGR